MILEAPEEEASLLPMTSSHLSNSFPPTSAHISRDSNYYLYFLRHLRLRTITLFSFSLTVIYLLITRTSNSSSFVSPILQHGYSSQPHKFAGNVGERPIGDEEELPFLMLPGGTRHPHPLPPSWPNPWEHKPRIASEWLAATRFPPLEWSIGVDADSMEMRKRREEVGLGTKPLSKEKSWQVPDEHYQEALEYSRWWCRGWETKGLNRGETYDSDGRRGKIPRNDIELGQGTGWKPTKLGARKKMPKVQFDFEDTSEMTLLESQRREWVRRAFLHLWESYKAHAWGHDEVRPISGFATDSFNGWGATIVDSIDMLLLLGLEDEYELARTHIASLDFSYLTPRNPTNFASPSSHSLPSLKHLRTESSLALPLELQSPKAIPVFETVIRYLGALLSAYDLSHDPLMLERAKDLGDWLLPVFGTKSGLSVPTYQMGSNPAGKDPERVSIAEVASLTLEFTRLSQLTGDEVYFDVVSRSMEFLNDWPATPNERLGKLFPISLNPSKPSHLPGTYSFGGQADSWVEYLIKGHQLLGGATDLYSKMYDEVMDSAHKYLIKPINVVSGIEDMVTIGDAHFKEVYNDRIVSWFSMRLDHLTCFAGGMMGLGAKLLGRSQDFDVAKKFTAACMWAYDATRTGLAPEIMELWSEDDPDRVEVVSMPDGTRLQSVKGDPMGMHWGNNYHIQRPETIESVWYMYRLTGDRMYQDKGWRMFTSWVEHTIVDKGFAHLNDVNSPLPQHDDSGVESFVYTETLKYYYLLFSPPDLLSLDDYVFTTEAHPLRLPNERNINRKPDFWTRSPLKLPRTRMGEGTTIQKWARVLQAAASKEAFS